jgi:hypothetical protein
MVARLKLNAGVSIVGLAPASPGHHRPPPRGRTPVQPRGGVCVRALGDTVKLLGPPKASATN